MGPVVDSLYEFLCNTEADGSKGMDIDLDVFKAVGDSAEGTSDEQRAKDLTTKEAYKSGKVDYLKCQAWCIDGSAKVPMWRLAVAEVIDPGDADNKVIDGLVKELLEAWAIDIKDGMKTSPLAD